MSTENTPLLNSRQPQNYLPEKIVYGTGTLGSVGFAGYQWLTSSGLSSEWKAALATAGVFAVSVFGLVRTRQHANSESVHLAQTPDHQGEQLEEGRVPSVAGEPGKELDATILASTQADNIRLQEEVAALKSQIARLTNEAAPSPAPQGHEKQPTFEELMSMKDSPRSRASSTNTSPRSSQQGSPVATPRRLFSAHE